MLREALEKNPNMSQEEAKALIMRCMKVLHYRDARSLNRVSPDLSLTMSLIFKRTSLNNSDK